MTATPNTGCNAHTWHLDPCTAGRTHNVHGMILCSAHALAYIDTIDDDHADQWFRAHAIRAAQAAERDEIYRVTNFGMSIAP